MTPSQASTKKKPNKFLLRISFTFTISTHKMHVQIAKKWCPLPIIYHYFFFPHLFSFLFRLEEKNSTCEKKSYKFFLENFQSIFFLIIIIFWLFEYFIRFVLFLLLFLCKFLSNLINFFSSRFRSVPVYVYSFNCIACKSKRRRKEECV